MTFDELYPIEKRVDDMPIDELRKTTHDLLSYILNIGSDLDYYRCIINGTWPDADECIKAARANQAKTHVDARNLPTDK